MKKLLTVFLFLMMVTAGLFAAGEQEGSSDASVQTIELVAATINPEGSLLADTLQAYSDEIESQSGGVIVTDNFFGGQLGDASTLFQSVIDGTVDMIYSDPGWFAERHPEFDILEGNYLFKSKEHFMSIANDEHKLDFFKDKLVSDPGVVVLMVAGGLERDIISTMRIDSIDDLSGVNMRSKSTSTNMDWWSALGANPVPIAFNEVYTAVQTGVVNGSQNSLDAMISMRFAEVNNFVARTQHNISIGFIVMNKDKYDSLGADLQDVLKSAAKKVQPEYLEKAFALSDEKLKALKEEFGLVVTYPDKAPFIEASRKLINDMAIKYGVTEEFKKIFE